MSEKWIVVFSEARSGLHRSYSPEFVTREALNEHLRSRPHRDNYRKETIYRDCGDGWEVVLQ